MPTFYRNSSAGPSVDPVRIGFWSTKRTTPLSTLNHFAKDVGIPQNLEAAVRNIFTGHVVNVDVGEVNGRAAFGSYRKPKKSPVSIDRDILATYPLFLLNKGCPRACQLLLLL